METTPAGRKKATPAWILSLARSKFKRSVETKEKEKRARLRMLAMRRARKEEDLQDTPGIFCSQMTAMAYKVAGVMYREYEHPLVRGSANYTPHDWGDHNDELQLGLRFGAWHSKEVV